MTNFPRTVGGARAVLYTGLTLNESTAQLYIVPFVQRYGDIDVLVCTRAQAHLESPMHAATLHMGMPRVCILYMYSTTLCSLIDLRYYSRSQRTRFFPVSSSLVSVSSSFDKPSQPLYTPFRPVYKREHQHALIGKLAGCFLNGSTRL